jgi:hypothetical protein
VYYIVRVLTVQGVRLCVLYCESADSVRSAVVCIVLSVLTV